MTSQDEHRLERGRFYTGAKVAELALALAEPRRGDRIWDPTCGAGSFLQRAIEAGHRPELLFGHDLEPEAVKQARANVPGAQIEQGDLFALRPSELGCFDVIAGNPPFVRAERLPAKQRAALNTALGEALGMAPSTKCDLSLLALLHCARFLAPGGRLAFVMPNTWMDANFGRPLRRWLLERLRLRALVESRVEPWFPEASVNTHIAVFERTERPMAAVFAQLKAPASAELARAVLGRQGDLRIRRRLAPADELLGQERWSPILRAPAVWHEVLNADGDALAPIADPARPRLETGYGLKVGVAHFFSPRSADAFHEHGVEDELLVPFFRTLRDLHRYELRGADSEARLFLCRGALDPDKHPGAARWIAWGAAQHGRSGTPWPHVPSLRANKPWYALRDPVVGDLILPQFRMDRHYVAANPEGVLHNNSAWWGRWLRPRWREPGAALMNSSWMALAAEVLGRLNLGEGLLTCYGPDLGAMPLPDPERYLGTEAGARLAAAWEQLRGRPVLPWPEEVHAADRQALDAAMLAGIGLPESLGARIREATALLMRERIELARALRERRRGGEGSAH